MRLGDTHWGSHYVSLLNIIIMFSSIMNVLEGIERTTLIKILKKKKKNGNTLSFGTVRVI